ncbi:hypothetical protein [Streptomyces sp. NPDC050585]|uniref:hypothetical protein n=1 Tax=unclassified Streptomyces TaxID=2593676 RepID=UPI00379AD3F8
MTRTAPTVGWFSRVFPTVQSATSPAAHMSARPLALVVAPGDETYRGYCLEQVAPRTTSSC